MDTPKQNTQPVKDDPLDSKLAAAIGIPKGDVLIRKVGGPDGIHSYLGEVKRGRVYCLSIEHAAHVMHPSTGEFEPVFQCDRTRIEAASKKAQGKVKTKAG